MTFNMAGSPTFGLYTSTTHANEISAGSVLVKPGDFDLPILKAFQPAAFIATPALKVSRGIRCPRLNMPIICLASRNRGQQFLSMAAIGWRIGFPGRLKNSTLFGRSSNQKCWSARRAQIWPLMILCFCGPHKARRCFCNFPKSLFSTGDALPTSGRPCPYQPERIGPGVKSWGSYRSLRRSGAVAKMPDNTKS